MRPSRGFHTSVSLRAASTTTLLCCFAMAALDSLTAALHFTLEPKSIVVPSDDSDVTLKCATEPSDGDIRWFVNGTAVVPEVHGGVLRLDTIRGSPEGSYQCLANSSMGAMLSSAAAVSVARLDAFATDLAGHNITVVDGGTAVIPCAVPFGVPPPKTEFERNRISVRLNARRHILPSGNLQLSPVTSRDKGTYRCIAVNPVTSERLASPYVVNLRVQGAAAAVTSAATFSWTPPATVEVVAGGNVTLECSAEGFPLPRLTWSRQQGDLPQDRHSYIFGNLVLNGVQRGDQGTYVCRIESPGGTPQESVTVLEVLEPPVIIEAPRDETVTEGGSVRLPCVANGRPVARIRWFHNGSPVIPGISIELSDDGSLTLSNARLEAAGIYQCVANNAAGSVYATATLVVMETTSTTVAPSRRRSSSSPQPPVSDTANTESNDVTPSTTRSKSRARSSTLPPAAVSSPTTVIPVGEYVITGSTVSATELTTTTVATTTTTTTKTAMKTTATVKSSSVTEPRSMVPHSSEPVIAEPVVPSRPQVSRKTNTSVLLEWTVAPVNGSLPIMFFKVQYEEVASGGGGGKKHHWQTVDEDIPAGRREFQVTDLKPGLIYRFRIAAVYSNNDNRLGPATRFALEPHLKPDRLRPPTPAPLIVKVLPLSNTSLGIVWRVDSDAADRSDVDGFVIEYRPYEAEHYLNVTLRKPQSRETTLSNLEPGTSYSLRMASFNAAGRSDYSDNVVQTTLDDPAGDTARSRTGNTISVLPNPPVITGDQPLTTIRNEIAYVPNRLNTRSSHELLYVVLGVVLGSSLLTLIAVTLVCAWKHRRHQQMIAARRGGSKFHDPARVIYLSSTSRHGGKPAKAPGSSGAFLLSTIDSAPGNRLANGGNPSQQHAPGGGWRGSFIASAPYAGAGQTGKKTELSAEPAVVSTAVSSLGQAAPAESIELATVASPPCADVNKHDTKDIAAAPEGASNADAGTIPRPRDLAPSNSQQHLQRSLRSDNGSRQSSSLNRDRRTSPDHIPRMHECWSLEPVRRAANRDRVRTAAGGEPSSEMSSLDSFPLSSRQMSSGPRGTPPEHQPAPNGADSGQESGVDASHNAGRSASTKPLLPPSSPVHLQHRSHNHRSSPQDVSASKSFDASVLDDIALGLLADSGILVSHDGTSTSQANTSHALLTEKDSLLTVRDNV